MMDTLTHCFNGVHKTYDESLTTEASPIYRDDLNLPSPTETNSFITSESLLLQKPTKKSLQRSKRIDKSLRFQDETAKPLAAQEGLKPRKVVRFQLEDNTIVTPKKFNEKSEVKVKLLEEKEGLSIVKEEVVRVKIKMTKQEAQRLLAKRRNDSVLDLEHVVNQIANVPVHQIKVAVVVMTCNGE